MEGKFLIHREIFESDIWEKPAHFLKIWIWILGKANWKTVKKGGKTYHRGEFLTSFKETMESNEWKVGWRTEKLTKDKIWDVYEFLRKTKRITTTKATRELWVKVIDYDYSQTLSLPKSSNEGNNESNKEATVRQQGKRKKDVIQMKESPEGERKSPNPEIDFLIFFLKEKNGLERLDGSEKINRQYANICIKKFGSEETKKIIEMGSADEFHSQNMTNLKYIFNNAEKIKKSGDKPKKPYYRGNPMRKIYNKWQVLEKGEWLEFADKESEIELK